jgi:hypothetical protein
MTAVPLPALALGRPGHGKGDEAVRMRPAPSLGRGPGLQKRVTPARASGASTADADDQPVRGNG